MISTKCVGDNQKKVIILGCGGHARSICDTLLDLSEQYEITGFVGRIEDKGVAYEGIQVIGADDDLQQIYNSGIHQAVLGIGFLGHGNLRNDLMIKLDKIGFSFPTIIDPTAIVSKSVKIGEGTFIGKNAVVNANAWIGRYCIINSCSLIEHDCRIGDFTHVAVAACVCGGVTVGKECLVGANATIIQGLSLADYSIIPAGNVIYRDIKTNSIKEKADMRENITGG
ncbi:acetyltransferase [Lachnospiraceae bacterium 38-10]